jgi:hypothetical protein
MKISATVRVRLGTTDRESPDRKRLEQAAHALKQAGFDVLRIGRFGISVRGTQDHFLRVLGVEVDPGKAAAVRIDVPDRQLRDLFDLVEIATNPTLY